jgi:O-acetyl-ADP-ribose deacetylase (regulator of RNase III)
MSPLRVVLVDINPRMIESWKDSFEENPEVQIVQGSMLDQVVDAWVSPTNSRGVMGGGLDGIIRKHLGNQIQTKVQAEIAKLPGGQLPIGQATCVPTGYPTPKFLISTPTMSRTREDVSATMNVALACAAAFQAAALQNKRQPGSITSIALPGLGAANGNVPVEICADLMWTAYNLFQEGNDFATWDDIRTALEEQLGDLDPLASKAKKTQPAAPSKKPNAPSGHVSPAPPPATPSVKKADVDFDDAE